MEVFLLKSKIHRAVVTSANVNYEGSLTISGVIQLNGATAHLGKPGDRLTIMSFGAYDPEETTSHQPKVILLDEKNQVIKQQ